MRQTKNRTNYFGSAAKLCVKLHAFRGFASFVLTNHTVLRWFRFQGLHFESALFRFQFNGLSNNGQTPNPDTSMPQFLYRIRPVRVAMLAEGPTNQEVSIIGEHFTYLAKLVEDGIVLMAGRTLNTDAQSFGIVVFVSESEPEARALMDGDPAVRQGLMEAELFPFTVALWSSKRLGGSENAA